jgi:Rieske Fe-S protein
MSEAPSRRDFFGRTLTWVLGALSAAAGAFFPLRAVFGAAGLDTVRVGPEAIPLGKLSDFPDGAAREVRVRAPAMDAWLTAQADVGSVYVVRDGADALVFSGTCPHLGCPVDYNARERRFECPCHRSVFALDGRRVTGPAPRGLDRLESAVVNGELDCRYARFLPGIAERRPI